MLRGNRKSAPRVVEGRVRKKNNWDLSRDYYDAPSTEEVVIDRKRPGEGYRHVLTTQDIHRFLAILPDWDDLAIGLNAIVLAPGEPGLDGYHVPGVVHICAWEAGLWQLVSAGAFFDRHRPIFERLGVEFEESEGGYNCKFDARAVRAYQLLHILLHELGHHHDRMTTRSRRKSSRGEDYAEQYALRHETLIWDRYWKEFGE